MSGKVFDELTCPECGGLIGGESGQPGVKPCTCFAPSARAARARLPDEPDPLDMVANRALQVAAGEKICRVCGKDLRGRTRMKDELGYICKKCSDAEYAAETSKDLDAIECPECHRRLKPGGFIEYRGTLICKRCYAYHQDNDKLKVAKVELTHHAEEEKKSVKTLAIIGGVLVLMALVKVIFF